MMIVMLVGMGRLTKQNSLVVGWMMMMMVVIVYFGIELVVVVVNNNKKKEHTRTETWTERLQTHIAHA